MIVFVVFLATDANKQIKIVAKTASFKTKAVGELTVCKT